MSLAVTMCDSVSCHNNNYYKDRSACRDVVTVPYRMHTVTERHKVYHVLNVLFFINNAMQGITERGIVG